MKTKTIVNPMARRGNCGKRWPEIAAKLKTYGIDSDIVFTKVSGEATHLASTAIADGYRRIIAVGGDGTFNEVLNGMMQDGALVNPDVVAATIPAGTANEVCRSLGLLASPEAAYQVIADDMRQPCDIQLIECASLDGGMVRRHSALVTSVGAAALVSNKTSNSKYIKKLGGAYSYFICMILATFGYTPTDLHVQIDDGPETTRRIYTALICNMRYVGGGMDIAPMATPDNGRFDLVEFGDFGWFELFTKPPSWLFEGKHIDHEKVTVSKGRRLHISGRDDVMVDSDGETVGRLPLTVEVKPKLLTIHAP